jgi:hypothetical protein
MNMIDSGDVLLKYLAEARKLASARERVFFDLTNVEGISSDAITVLLATLKHPPFHKTMYGGNAPSKSEFREVLRNSGFYEHMASSEPKDKTRSALMITANSNTVLSATAREMRRFATINTLGKDVKYRAIQETAVDCMANSQEHAKPGHEGAYKWFFNVYFDKHTKVTKFTFVDLGVGILKSIQTRDQGFFQQIFSISKSNVQLLKGILQGKVGSRTNQPNRGKGLPRMYQYFRQGLIHRFVVISNDVYADFERGNFRTLKRPFHGTLISWELRPQTEHDRYTIGS